MAAISETIKNSLKFVFKSIINNNPALFKIMIRRQAIIWTNADPVHWGIYAALEGDELTLAWNDFLYKHVLVIFCPPR